MCGRFTIAERDVDRLGARFAVAFDERVRTAVGRANVCPTEDLLAVRGAGERRAELLRWGLRRPRGRGERPGPINARSETAAASGLFGPLLARPEGRCLVVADGWYEWLAPERPRAPRSPLRFTVDGGAPFAFAGLVAAGTACVLTTAAGPLCAPVHDRMPCVLADPAAEDLWLRAPDLDAATAAELLGPLPDARLAVAPAHPDVGRAGVEGTHLLTAPAEAVEEPQATLW